MSALLRHLPSVALCATAVGCAAFGAATEAGLAIIMAAIVALAE